ncbi:conjugal transfer mating pair stabilization protein TraG [Candidatus Rubidus massiliensis]|nr:conjugal transfer mating pair stabilization protein TraG [Candidatus Rubidus massiliensis]
MNSTIYTYGGLDWYYYIFNAIAMLFYGDGTSIVRPLMFFSAMLGCFCILVKSLFKPSFEGIFLHYLVPLIVISIIFVPHKRVRIEDCLTQTSKSVDNVPLPIAMFGEIISTIGYKITTAFETAMHLPHDEEYEKTGMLLGAESYLDISKYKIANADLEENLKSFSKQCIFYDIALGKYSLDQMKKATDLWDFFEKNASQVRMIKYSDPYAKSSSLDKYKYLTCQQAVAAMKPIFEQEKNFHATPEIVKNLPFTFKALTNITKEADNLISQLLMINFLTKEFSSTELAKSRAYQQQRSYYITGGGLSQKSIIMMRIIFECLLYGSIILIIPLSLLPMGYSLLFNWMKMMVWVQMWGPFYTILNYLMKIAAREKTHYLFPGESTGLSLFTSEGLDNIAQDVFALAGYLTLLVAYISYSIMFGGIGSLIHLASSIMSPSQNAAATASNEQSTGNYSFANASYGQTSYKNATAFQENYAASISSGYMSENTGSYQAIYTTQDGYLKQNNSDLLKSVTSDEAINSSFQKAQQTAESYLENTQKSFAESIAQSGKTASDLTEHLTNSSNYNENISYKEAEDIQNSARYCENAVENWGKQFGLNKRESWALIASASAGIGEIWKCFGVSAGITTSKDRNVSQDELINSAINFSRNVDFQKNLQKINGFAESQSTSSIQDETTRISYNYCNAIDEVKNSQSSYQNAINKMEQVSENITWAKNNSLSFRENLNQEFINWANCKTGGFSNTISILNGNNDNLKGELIQSFISQIKQNDQLSYNQKIDPNKSFQNAMVNSINKEEVKNLLWENYMSRASAENISKDQINEERQRLVVDYDRNSNMVTEGIKNNNSYNSEKERYISHRFEKEYDKYGYERLAVSPMSKGIFKIEKGSNIVNKIHQGEIPEWIKN